MFAQVPPRLLCVRLPTEPLVTLASLWLDTPSSHLHVRVDLVLAHHQGSWILLGHTFVFMMLEQFFFFFGGSPLDVGKPSHLGEIR